MKITYFQKASAPTGEALPLSRTPFSMLPLGDIRPTGWLLEQQKRMADGITGRLPEYGPFFKPENNGYLYPEVQKGWEEVPYWLRGYYPLAVLLDQAQMLETAKTYIEAIFRSAQSDGWFGLAHLKEVTRTEDGAPIPDLFPNMLLTDTLILYYTHTKDGRVLSLLKRYFDFCRALSDRQLLPPTERRTLRWQKIRGGEMLHQLYWYYGETGDAGALSLAERVHRSIAVSLSGYISNHAVDFSLRFAYDAIYSRQSGRAEDFERSERAYRTFADTYGQMPRGIFAADEQIRDGATDPRQGFEPCGIVELAKNFYELTRISGDGLYADRAEDVMLNHFAASFTPDYRQIHYVTSSNSPILSNDLYAATFNGSASHDRSYQIMTPNNRCCGHNTGMGWPLYTANLWQKTADGGVAAMLYAPCTVDTTVGGTHICLTVETDYPFKEEISVTVRSGGTFPMVFRIPAWCKRAECRINDAPIAMDVPGGGWLSVENEWRAGNRISLRFPMEISLTKWRGNGSVSVDRGPLTYSVRIREEYHLVENAFAYHHPTPHLWENYEILPRSAWNYGLVATEKIDDFLRVRSVAETIAAQPFSEENAPVVLVARAKKIPEWKLQDSCAAELQQSPIASDEPEELIEMIPMGCARLRMACLPVIGEGPLARRWKEVPAHIPCEERPQAFALSYDFSERTAEHQNAPWKPEEEK